MSYATHVTHQKYHVCDSYFVENHDDADGIYARASAERQGRRAFDRARQKRLAQDISILTANEYESDILQHMERMEAETLPDVSSIEVQTEIQWFMRPYLLDFLLEAHQAFGLLPETFFLTVNLLDRYCSRRVVYKRHYQLVGCAALLIAAKYGDRKERVPSIRELKSMCCSLYDEDMFTQMEWHVLQTLNWIVGHPTVSSFMELALYEAPQEPAVEHMALYISELAMYHKELMTVRPSVMARSSLALARCILGQTQSLTGDWASLYDASIVLDLSNHLAHPSQALYRKYAYAQLSSVSLTVEAFLQQQARIARQTVPLDCSTIAQSAAPQMTPVDVYIHPQTPQKAAYHVVPAGVLTPPITPDTAFNPVGSFGPGQSACPPTRSNGCAMTPPSSGDHRQPQHYQSAYPSFVR